MDKILEAHLPPLSLNYRHWSLFDDDRTMARCNVQDIG